MNASIHHLTVGRACCLSPELRVPGEGGDYPGETLDADGVGAGQQLGVVLGPVIVTQTGAARQERLIEVFVVNGDRLH